jgi:hypothetical protein
VSGFVHFEALELIIKTTQSTKFILVKDSNVLNNTASVKATIFMLDQT